MEGIIQAVLKNTDLSDQMYKELLSKRILYYNDEINDVIVDKITMPILMFNQAEKDIPIEELQPLTIHLNTDGGDLGVTLQLVEVIKKSRIPIHVVVMSRACSAGLLITIACKKRFAHADSIFLLHEGETQLQGNTEKVNDTYKFYEQLFKKVEKVILENTRITEKEYKKIKRIEFWCFGQDAKDKYGFVDEIIA